MPSTEPKLNQVHTLTIELKDLPFETANNGELLDTLATKIVTSLNHTVLESKFHFFEPQGVTGFLLLAESHLALHSWPERNYLHITFATCRNFTKKHQEQILEILRDYTGNIKIKTVVSQF